MTGDDDMEKMQIAIILHMHDETRFQHLLAQVNGLRMPRDSEYTVYKLRDGDIGTVGNYAYKEIPPGYKVYISDAVQDILNKNLIVDLLNSMFWDSRAVMAGLLGSNIPLYGDFLGEHVSLYGRHDCHAGSEGGDSFRGINPPMFQTVHAIQPWVVATKAELIWDERLRGIFCCAAQALRLKEAGYRTVVPRQNEAWCTYYDASVYRQERSAEYEQDRELFCRYYRDAAEPLVSILIPAYNQPDYFKAALDSALAQDYGRTEIIVGDDSTDGRIEDLIQPYMQKFGERIQYEHHDKPLGESGLGNMKSCLAKAKGAYINFLYHDDLLYPHKISRMLSEYQMDIDEEIGFVTSARDFIDADGRIAEHSFVYQPYEDCRIPGKKLGHDILVAKHNFVGELTTMLLRRQDALNFGEYYGVPDRSMWDVSTALEISRTGKYCLYLAEKFSAFRHHKTQNSNNPGVLLVCHLDWLAFLTVSWLHDVYVDEGDFWDVCRKYLRVFDTIPLDETNLPSDPDFAEKRRVCRELASIYRQDDRMLYLDCMVNYMLGYTHRPEQIVDKLQKDEQTGQWRKKDSL